jgi:uncharacterized integral membrane protein
MEHVQQPKDNISLWQKVKIVLGTALAIFIIVLIIQNWNAIALNLVFSTVETPLPVVIVICLITGYIWGSFSAYRKNRRKNNQQN